MHFLEITEGAFFWENPNWISESKNTEFFVFEGKSKNGSWSHKFNYIYLRSLNSPNSAVSSTMVSWTSYGSSDAPSLGIKVKIPRRISLWHMPATICCEELLRCQTKKIIDQDHFWLYRSQTVNFLNSYHFCFGIKMGSNR